MVVGGAFCKFGSSETVEEGCLKANNCHELNTLPLKEYSNEKKVCFLKIAEIKKDIYVTQI